MNSVYVKLPYGTRKEELRMRTWIRMNTTNPKWTKGGQWPFADKSVYLTPEDAIIVKLKFGL